MKRELLINAAPRETRVAILEDDELVELLVDRPEARRMVGDIYLGRVEAVLPGIQAAFVDIGTEKSAFLHASDLVFPDANGDGDDEEDEADDEAREEKDDALAHELRRQSQRGNDPATSATDDERKIKEQRLHCLEQCLSKLESANREIIARYYIGKARVKIEHRRALAEDLGITMNALSIRACRIRDKLETCVRECVSAGWHAAP